MNTYVMIFQASINFRFVEKKARRLGLEKCQNVICILFFIPLLTGTSQSEGMVTRKAKIHRIINVSRLSY